MSAPLNLVERPPAYVRLASYALLAAVTACTYVVMFSSLSRVESILPRERLPLVVTGVIAMIFGPLKRRMMIRVNDMLGTPSSDGFLIRYAEQVRGAYADEMILEQLARDLRDAVDALALQIVLVDEGQETVVARSGPSTADHHLPARHDFEITADRERVGVFRFSMRVDDVLSPHEQRLIEDLAAQAGPVMRNVRYTVSLQDHLVQLENQARALRHARRRLVEAHDEERVRVERNIHDGCQQQLIALVIRLSLIERRVERGESATPLLIDAAQAAAEARESLDSAAAGLVPSILAIRGVGAALRARAAGIDGVRLVDRLRNRFPPATEEAVFLVCLEALQNAAKHARAGSITVELEEANAGIRFSIVDDGVGFERGADPAGAGLASMAKRMAMLSGSLDIVASPGRGTKVFGWLPSGAAP